MEYKCKNGGDCILWSPYPFTRPMKKLSWMELFFSSYEFEYVWMCKKCEREFVPVYEPKN